ncbi:hypothetical protein CspHIS471_0401210 [Cutaneotrichosporon sp. HIS471]|nr:hypothetical protein CspHIS471_0401210 [Cutaneotrichosporon sp. HIS471]
MGRKARTKQGVPAPISDADIAKLRKGGAEKPAKPTKKTSSAKPSATAPIKAKAQLPAKKRKRVKAVDVVDEDSDAEEALEQGDWSDEEEMPAPKAKKAKGKAADKPKKKKAASPEIERGPARELVFSDSEDEFAAAANGEEQMPTGQHAFDLDLAPSDEEDEEMMDDDFGFPSEDDEMEDDDVDSAFASDDEEGGDVPMEEDEEDDEDAIQTNLEDDLDDEGYTLPAVDGVDEEHEHGVSLRDVENRMRWLVQVCTAAKDEGIKGVPGKSRSDHLVQLEHDIATYFGYNHFLVAKLMKLFTADEALAFFESNESPRPVTIRANTLRTRRRDLAQALINRGVNLEPIGKWSKVGLQVFESPVPVGATPEYLAGHYMLQAASSFLPVIALAPQPGERVLDMASAPGGKTTYISALLQNTGLVFANDSNKARTKSLTANVHRMGCKNVVVCNYDAREFPRVLGGFDRVLLDAPCSGTGVISKDQSVKVNKSERDFQLLAHLQKQLILCALDSVNANSATGGYVVYSTCSVTVDEDESVVDYALRKRPHCKLVETGLEFGVPGFTSFEGKHFNPSLSMTRRYYPHKHNMDGFYVAKFKVGKRAKKTKETEGEDEAAVPVGEDGAEANTSTFNAAEDNALIAESKRKHLLKTKGIKLKKGEAESATPSPAKPAPKPAKGKKVTEARRKK